MKNKVRYLLIGMMVFMLSIVSVQAGSLPETAGKTKWSVRPGTSSYVTPPTYGNNKIYVGSGSKVYRLNKDTGKTEVTSDTLTGTVGYAVIPVTYVKEKNLVVVITIKGSASYITGLDGNTLEKKWESSSISGQVLTKVTYSNGKLYTGSWMGGETGSGSYYELNATPEKTTNPVNSVAHRDIGKGGFYWAGAGVYGGYIIFGSEDGADGIPSLYTYNQNTKQIEQLDLSKTGDVRSRIVVEGNYLYFTSKAGYFHKVTISDDGKLSEEKIVKLSGASTSTPVISDGKAYVGVSSKSVVEIDTAQMKISKSYGVSGYVQGDMLLKDQRLYMTYNQSPGGLYMIDLTTGKGSDIYYPEKSKRQYCISHVITDEEGTLFYKNDSGYIFAVNAGLNQTEITVKNVNYQKNMISWEKVAGASGYHIYQATSYGGSYSKIASTSSLNYTKSNLKSNQTYYYKVRPYNAAHIGSFSQIKSGRTVLKSTSISLSSGKKKMKIKWKEVAGASGYVIYQKTSSKGKWKTIKTIKKGSVKSYTKTKLSKKKKYYYRVRAYRTQSGKRTYSSYSSTKSKKTK
ncbi:MAG: PQQ-binding-like beta-propeller repeat protein [Anaerostipes sp.]|nr:PQQ-binding-like beta-propeller repeat protein [Anaerostipes sp.]